jgi:hypothetical protein
MQADHYVTLLTAILTGLEWDVCELIATTLAISPRHTDA